jgi:ketosteroid isomerase-like protein
MTAESNRQIIVDMYESFATGDAQAMLRAHTEETVWVEPGTNIRSGAFRGPQAIGQHVVSCMEATGGTWGTDVVEIVGGDKYVIVVERALGQRNGKSLDLMCTTVYEMSDGTISEMRVLPFDAEVWDDFWS